MSVKTDSGAKLICGSIQIAKWSSYQVESDMLTPADAFSFGAPNPRAYLTGALHEEDEVRVFVDGELVCTGNLDEVREHGDRSGNTVECTGRDKGRFLVDCSALPVTIHGQTIKSLAEKLTAIWGIKWEIEGSVKLQPVKRMKVDPGESPMDVLIRFVDAAGCIIWFKEDGTGVIGKPNYKQAPEFELRRHRSGTKRQLNNILSGGRTRNSRERFSEIAVLASGASPAAGYAAGASKINGQALDLAIRNKPRILTGGALNMAQAKARAERMVQLGQFTGDTLDYVVPGHQNCGRLWRANSLCRVFDEVAGIDGELWLVRRRRFVGGDQGRQTELSLHPAGVWLP